MKLTLGKDLAPIRAAACAKIDAHAEASARALSACPTIHAVKALVAAAAGLDHSAFAAEAQARGRTPRRLAGAIAKRAAEQTRAILAIDAQRLARKRAVAAATSEQDIRAVVAAL